MGWWLVAEELSSSLATTCGWTIFFIFLIEPTCQSWQWFDLADSLGISFSFPTSLFLLCWSLFLFLVHFPVSFLPCTLHILGTGRFFVCTNKFVSTIVGLQKRAGKRSGSLKRRRQKNRACFFACFIFSAGVPVGTASRRPLALGDVFVSGGIFFFLFVFFDGLVGTEAENLLESAISSWSMGA